MEIFTYSLWFTFVWEIFWVYQGIRLQLDYRNNVLGKPEYMLILGTMIIVPLIAILLEYLIVR